MQIHVSGPLTGLQGWEKFPDSHRSEFQNTTLAHLSSFPADWPEAEYLVLEYANVDIVSANIEQPIGPDDNFITFAAVLLSTASRGSMTIASADTMDQPIIDPNWLADDGDVEQAYASFQRLREIMSNSSIVEAEIYPGPEVSEREDVIAWLRDNMAHIYHASCTCKEYPMHIMSLIPHSIL